MEYGFRRRLQTIQSEKGKKRSRRLAPKEGLILRLFQKNKEKILARLRLFMGTLVVAFEFSPPEIEAANWNYVRRLPEFLCSLESAHYFPSS